MWEIAWTKSVTQLYVNNTYAIRARYPDAGQELRLLYADTTLKQVVIGAEDVSNFSVSDFDKSVFVPTVSWGESFLRIKSVSSTTCNGNAAYALSFNSADNYFFTRSMKIHPRVSYHFENSKAFLDSCGEWFFDQTANKLYYLPFDYETLDNTTLRIPTTQTLVSVSGKKDSKIANVTFDGVSFMYTANSVDGKIGGQANINHSEFVNQDGINAGRPTAAFTVSYADGVVLKNNVFACLGGGAVDFCVGVTNSEVSSNVLKRIGGNGVMVGASVTDASVFLSEYAKNNQIAVTDITVDGNYVTDIGWQEYGGVGIIFTYVKNGYIKNNTVSGVNYSGISVGWGWQTLSTSTQVLGNLHVTSNKITNVCRTMNDGGAIYLTGCMPNSTVSGNYIKDVYNYVYHYPLDRTSEYQNYSQIWWANVGIYLDTSAGGDTQNNALAVYGNYIADDIENQKYEYCNTKLYYTIDGKSGENVGINPANSVTEQSVSLAGVTNVNLISSSAALYGSHTVDVSTVKIFGRNLLNSTVYVDGKLLNDNCVIAATDTSITLSTSGLSVGGHTVIVGDCKIYVTVGVDAVYDGITRFDNAYGGYSALSKMSVTKKTLTNFNCSSNLSGYTADMISDGYEYTGWSMDMSDESGSNAWVSFGLQNSSKVTYLIVYERAGGSFDVTTASNFRILGYDLLGREIELYNTNGALAFDNGGMLILDMQSLGYGSTLFKSFKIEKTVADEYFFVAEVAVI